MAAVPAGVEKERLVLISGSLSDPHRGRGLLHETLSHRLSSPGDIRFHESGNQQRYLRRRDAELQLVPRLGFRSEGYHLGPGVGLRTSQLKSEHEAKRRSAGFTRTDKRRFCFRVRVLQHRHATVRQWACPASAAAEFSCETLLGLQTAVAGLHEMKLWPLVAMMLGRQMTTVTACDGSPAASSHLSVWYTV
jgi:hypothetical protein